MKSERRTYRGVLQIVSFNWPFYVAGFIFVFFAAFLLRAFILPWPYKLLLLVGIGFSLFWIFSSLIAAHWIYDRTFGGSWEWVRQFVNPAPRSLGQFHAGFDETRGELQNLYPTTPWVIADILPQKEVITASLQRARQKQSGKALSINPIQMPYPPESFSGIFLIFAAHELRSSRTRLQFFAELHRVLEKGARILLVEHLRDFANFAAFGPNFVHSYSRREWLKCIQSNSLKVVAEFSKTPFIRIFVLEK